MKVHAERIGNRVHVKTPYSEDNVKRSKQVLGARWSKKAKAWTYPLDLEVCRLLRNAWGDDLVVGPELSAWGWEQRQRETALKRHVNVTDMDVYSAIQLDRVPELAPFMWEAMQNRPFQAVAAKYMAIAGESLCADQPGIGKTIESLAAIIESGVDHGHILVLAPKKSTIVVWETEIHRWLQDYRHGATTTLLTGMSTAQANDAIDEYLQITDDGLHFLIANAEMVRIKQATVCPADTCDGDEDWCPNIADHKNNNEVRMPGLFGIAWDAIIADETHKWLINTRGKQKSQVGYGFTKLKSREDGLRIALTGTPLKGKQYNLFGTLNWLRPKIFTSKWRWIEQYFEVFEDGWGGRVIGEMMNDEAFFRALDSVMIRRTKSELHKINPAWMPPDKIYHDLVIPTEGKQKKAYDEMTRDAAATLGGERLSATGRLAELTRLKQLSQSYGEVRNGTFYPTLPSNKLEWLLEFLSERGIDERGELSPDVRKVVIASQYTKLINFYSEQLTRKGIANYVITGQTKDKEAENIVRLWADMEDPVRVCLINIMAGGVSITLDAADDLVLNDETWVPDEQEQVEDRVHRASRVEHQVDIWYLRSGDTLEGDIMEANLDKSEDNHVVLDAQRGLEFARSIRRGK